jgi:RNA polymerase sigma factor (sigma-70 family)
MAHDSTVELQRCIDDLNAGDPASRDKLLSHSLERLERLTRKMLHDYPRVRQFELTDDVLQGSVMRLRRALAAVPINTVEEYFRLAACQIRRELIDLARHYSRPVARPLEECRTKGSDQIAQEPEESDSTYDPSKLARWTEFHEQVERLPKEERDVFDLIWYHGTNRVQAARTLGVSEATVKRRWLAARLRLRSLMQDRLPL